MIDFVASLYDKHWEHLRYSSSKSSQMQCSQTMWETLWILHGLEVKLQGCMY